MSMETAMRILWAIAICATPLVGCGCAKRKAEAPDAIVHELERVKTNMKDPEAKSRIATALSMRQNNVVDPKPVLIVVGVVADRNEGEKTFLRMAVYDEDGDVTGLGVCEEWNTVDGRRNSLVEKYPVFAHSQLSGVLCYPLVPVELRNSCQRKDGERWRVYAEEQGSYENSLRESASNGKTPPMYISIPEPNDIDVFVHVYDRSGHKSDPVRLVNHIAITR